MVSMKAIALGLVGALTGTHAYESDWARLQGQLIQLTYDGKSLCGVNAANNIYCADDNLDSTPNWRQIDGKLKWVAVWGDNLWGVNSNDDIFYGQTKGAPRWVQLPGKLKQISADGKQICGVNSFNDIFCADDGITSNPNWRQLTGKLKQVDLTDGIMYGIAPDNTIWFGMTDGEPSFTKINGGLTHISYDGELLCGVHTGSNNEIWCADDNLKTTPNWRKLDGAATNLDVQAGRIFAVGTDGNVYRKWLTPPPAFVSFTGIRQLQGKLSQVNFDGKTLAGVNAAGEIWVSSQGWDGAPNWRKIVGTLMQVNVWGDRLIGVNAANEIWVGTHVGTDPQWRKVPGMLKQISTDGKQICGINTANDIWCADSNIFTNPNWRMVDGKMKDIVVLNGVLFGVNDRDEIFTGRSKDAPMWLQLQGSLKNVEYDGIQLCGTNAAEDVWCANDGLQNGRPNWRQIDGKMSSVTINSGRLFGVNSNSDILSRMDL